jgi:hypothetical protein
MMSKIGECAELRSTRSKNLPTDAIEETSVMNRGHVRSGSGPIIGTLNDGRRRSIPLMSPEPVTVHCRSFL